MTMRKQTKLLKTTEVAEICGVSPRTVALWLRNGELTGIKLNKFQWRVREADLDEFLEGRQEKA
jgi:excisionase family DNA binding protein